MALSGLLVEVTRVMVANQLHQRQPVILHSDVPEQLARFEQRVRAASIEVRVLVGLDPPAGPFRELAVELVALETASATEYADYPEQQVQGEDGRGYFLHQQYLRLLERLQKMLDDAGGVVPPDGQPVLPTANLPRARFPDPSVYPDPVLVPGVTYTRSRYGSDPKTAG